MRFGLLFIALGSTCSNKSGSSSSSSSSSGMMKIHSITAGSPNASTTATPMLLIHGLDSSSATWKNVLQDLSSLSNKKNNNGENNNNNNNNNTNSRGRFVIAMDCRGCGYSADIDPDKFSLSSLVQDVNDCLTFHNNVADNKKVVLLGHSMGARIALSFAATYPHRVKCLIMEDMDIARRPIASAPFAITTATTATATIFDRSFKSQHEAVQALLQAGYPADRVVSWVQDGRIHYRPDVNNKWWSNVNPDFRRLCYQHVVDTDFGERDYNKLVTITSGGNKQDVLSKFPVHVLVAGEDGTICSEGSLQQMKQRNKQCKVHRFPGASHSIHSTDRVNYLAKIQEILNECDAE